VIGQEHGSGSDAAPPRDGTSPYLRIRAGIRAGAAYAVVAGLLAVSFGVVAEPVMGVIAPVVMSVTVFAGSAQFAALAVLGGGGGVVAAVLAGVLLNARYGPMGVALAPSLRGGPLRRGAIGQAMVDQSWALASRGEGRFDPAFMVGVTIPAYPLWVLGTAVGVLAGDVIGDPDRFGLDVVFPAFFLALLLAEMRTERGRHAAAVGAVIALVLLPVAPPGAAILAASAGALLGLLPSRRREAAAEGQGR
jgi:4-azaleucine resistance transporter AzlC